MIKLAPLKSMQLSIEKCMIRNYEGAEHTKWATLTESHSLTHADLNYPIDFHKQVGIDEVYLTIGLSGVYGRHVIHVTERVEACNLVQFNNLVNLAHVANYKFNAGEEYGVLEAMELPDGVLTEELKTEQTEKFRKLLKKIVYELKHSVDIVYGKKRLAYGAYGAVGVPSTYVLPKDDIRQQYRKGLLNYYNEDMYERIMNSRNFKKFLRSLTAIEMSEAT